MGLRQKLIKMFFAVLRTSQRFHKVGQGLYNIFRVTQKMLRDFFMLLYSKKPKKPRKIKQEKSLSSS